MLPLAGVLIAIVTFQAATALQCWSCIGYIPSECSRAVKNSMLKTECSEGNSFRGICIEATPRGYSFQNATVQRGCGRQYKDTQICARLSEQFNTTDCKLCSTDLCNSDVANDSGSFRSTRTRKRGHKRP